MPSQLKKLRKSDWAIGSSTPATNRASGGNRNSRTVSLERRGSMGTSVGVPGEPGTPTWNRGGENLPACVGLDGRIDGGDEVRGLLVALDEQDEFLLQPGVRG